VPPKGPEGTYKAGGALSPEAMQRAGELVTGKFAVPLIRAAGLPPPPGSTQELVVLDNGTGPGCVVTALMPLLDEQQQKHTKVTCGDVDPPSIAYVQGKVEKEKWGNVEVKTIDAQDTKLPSSSYTHVLSSFVIMLVPKPLAALEEVKRILVPGGVNGFTTWNDAGWIPWIERTYAAIPGCPPFPDKEKRLNPFGTGRWDLPDHIERQLREQGWEDIKVDVRLEKPVHESPEEFVRLFANMLLSLTTKWFTDEEKKEFTPKIKEVLLQQLQEEFGAGKPFEMPMTANIVTCRKPAN